MRPADETVPGEVVEDVVGLGDERRCGAMQATAEILHREGNARASGRGGVQQATNAFLYSLHSPAPRGAGRRERRERRERRPRTEGTWWSRAACGARVGAVAVGADELAGVRRLVELDRAVREVVDLDAEQVVNSPPPGAAESLLAGGCVQLLSIGCPASVSECPRAQT